MWQRQQPIDVTGASVGRPVRQGLYVSLPYQTAAVVHSYRQGQSTLVGVLLIVAGCVGAIFNVVDLGIGSQDKWKGWKGDFMFYTRSFSLSEWSNGVVGHGFWCGIMIITAGACGVGAARQKNKCLIVTFMVFAIIGCVVAAIQMIVAAAGASRVKSRYGHVFGPSSCDDCSEVTAVYAMEVLLALLGVGEFGLCLWGSILCCSGVCCPPQQTVATVPAGESQVTVISQQQPMQPMQPVQPYPPQPMIYTPPQQYPPQYPPQYSAGLTTAYPPKY